MIKTNENKGKIRMFAPKDPLSNHWMNDYLNKFELLLST